MNYSRSLLPILGNRLLEHKDQTQQREQSGIHHEIVVEHELIEPPLRLKRHTGTP